MIIAELAGGALIGVLFGFAMGLVRPLVVLLILLAAAAAFVTLITSGVSGLVNAPGFIADDIGQHQVFFTALALGNLAGVALVMR
ncbi:MAG: hypothetical protein ACREFK_04755 [Stellaceae bacterium]